MVPPPQGPLGPAEPGKQANAEKEPGTDAAAWRLQTQRKGPSQSPWLGPSCLVAFFLGGGLRLSSWHLNMRTHTDTHIQTYTEKHFLSFEINT